MLSSHEWDGAKRAWSITAFSDLQVGEMIVGSGDAFSDQFVFVVSPELLEDIR